MNARQRAAIVRHLEEVRECRRADLLRVLGIANNGQLEMLLSQLTFEVTGLYEDGGLVGVLRD